MLLSGLQNGCRAKSVSVGVGVLLSLLSRDLHQCFLLLTYPPSDVKRYSCLRCFRNVLLCSFNFPV